MRRDGFFVAAALLWWLAGCGTKAPVAPDRGSREGALVLTSAPSGAAVLADGRTRLGTTPLTLTRPDGTRLALTFVKDGYQVVRRSELVEAGTRREVHVGLRIEEIPVIVTSGVFRGARILVDGEARGTTPDRLNVPIGDRRLEVRKDGYHPFRQRVAVRAGSSPTVEADLVPVRPRVPAPGWLSVRSDGRAEVRLDGRRVGATPVERLRLTPRSYRLTVVSQEDDGGGRDERALVIRASEHEEVVVNFRARGAKGDGSGPAGTAPGSP